jgi:NADP-reducing hydrogenase subunit HndB
MNIAQLEKIQKETLEKMNTGIRIAVGMPTCGIAAGAKPVLEAIQEEIEKVGLDNVTVTQVGCVGACRLEPMFDVIKDGGEKVTYVLMTPEKAKEVVKEHIIGGKIVEAYTVGAEEA